MPRKGSEKVRTGCITCKARRVKCDERHPTCFRCQSAGRECKGYGTSPTGCFRWSYLLALQNHISEQAPLSQAARPSLIPSFDMSQADYRSLDFFRHVAAPLLAGPLDGSFWRNAVMQHAVHSNAARHAVIAISLLYEGFEAGSEAEGDAVVEKSHARALMHYNKALRIVTTMSSGDLDSVLLVAVLFTCIEFLLGHVQSAINHCRHGLLMVLGCPVDKDVIRRLHHLCIFPFFFDASLSPDNFPVLQRPGHSMSGSTSAADLGAELDWLMSRAVRLVRSLDAWRLEVNGVEMPSDTWSVQDEILGDLREWYISLERLRTETEANKKSSDEDQYEDAIRHMEARYLVCWIWTRIASSRDERAADAYIPQFRRIIELGKQDTKSGDSRRGKFNFGMGMYTLLHFVVIKCRHLRLRLEALQLLKTAGCSRESLWDIWEMYAIGRSIVEREHMISLHDDDLLDGAGWEEDDVLPVDENRIRDSVLDERVEEVVGNDGEKMLRRKIWFFVKHGGVVRRDIGWVDLPPA